MLQVVQSFSKGPVHLQHLSWQGAQTLLHSVVGLAENLGYVPSGQVLTHYSLDNKSVPLHEVHLSLFKVQVQQEESQA